MTKERLLALCLAAGGGLGLLAFLATLEPVVGVGVFAVVLAGYWLWFTPVRHGVFALMVLGLTIESPHERPFAGEWHSPFSQLGYLLFHNLHHTIHVPFLRVSGMELGLLLLVGLVLVRKAWGLGIDPPPLPSPKPLRQALMLAFFAVLALEAWGLWRGGDLKQSLFQMRTLLFTPVVAFLGLYALRGPRDVGVVGRIIVWAAVYRTALGFYFLKFVANPQGLYPPYVTTHTDTVLFSLALVVLVARWWEAPSLRRLLEGGGVGLWVLYGVYLNDRRLAYVTLAGCLLAMLLVSPWNRAKRFVTRVAVLSLPLLVGYVTVGWNSGGRLFKPVQSLKTIVAPEEHSDSSLDASTEFRFLENFNLVQTWKAHPLMGSGFGHEYDEVVMLPDISRFMPDYRFQPHNSALWLLGIGGVVGFSALWLYLAVVAFFAVRAYHAAVAPEVRAMMVVGLSAVIAYANQVYGDMGSQSYTSVLTLAPLVALVGQVAVASGAWRVTKPAAPRWHESPSAGPAARPARQPA